ncbi:HNH endonuclease signature motif containing protein [Mycolicibacterium goodii]|uniref:HNH endonuclease n=1 Tax=Mycolicibacterium goodii TaxID=134601 RepID=A0A0K0X8Z8_MYCGD|nr:HNH endonuclease [Mycolicibacterium goodii]
MFDHLDDGALMAAIGGSLRDESAAAARRFALIAEFVDRRSADFDDPVVYWACDDWDATAAEIAAALHVGHRVASKQMRIAVALRDRLPLVAALFAEGAMSVPVVTTLTWRTRLIDNAQVVATVDAHLASRIAEFGAMTIGELESAVDKVVDSVDPAAVMRTRTAVRNRDVRFGHPDDETGTTSVFARLTNADAVALKTCLQSMSSSACSDDPRTKAQRRSDALGVLGHAGDRLPCRCGDPECPAAGADPRGADTLIHVIAEAAAVRAAVDRYLDGDYGSNPIPFIEPQPESQPEPTPEPEPQPEPTPEPESETPAGPRQSVRPARGGAVVLGGGVLSAPLVAQLIADGAKVKELTVPDDVIAAYRPSAAMDRFVRMRDLTCRFPGCSRPAEFCDVDHTTPWPLGPTHPSNTKCLCRLHHLLKTFWTGWTDQQLPDGTVVWTSPTGRIYTTVPASRALFPQWDTTTAALPPPPTPPPATPVELAARAAMMPRRRRTRAAERARHIAAERARNEAYLAQRDRPPPDE